MRQGLLIIILSLLVSGTGIAQDTTSLSMKDAENYALEHNRRLKNAALDIQKAEAARWQAYSSMLPQVNASIDYTNMLGYEMKMMGFNIAMPAYGTLGLTTSITFSAAQFIGMQMAEIAMRMSDISMRQTEQQIKNQVRSIYYSILVMEETVKLLEKNLENLDALKKHTENSVKVGILEQVEADRISVQVITMENGVRSTKRSLEMLYNSMRLLLGLDVNKAITLTQSINELVNPESETLLTGEEFKVENNYNYMLMMQNAELSKKQVTIKKWAYAPTVTAFHTYSGKQYFSDEETMNMTAPNMIGIQVRIPIFSSGNKFAGVKESAFEYEKQLNTLEDLEESLTVQHRQLLYNLTSAYESFEAQKNNIKLAQSVFDNISRKFEHGMASALDVTNSGNSLITAQNSYVQALMELVTAQIALEELLNIETH